MAAPNLNNASISIIAGNSTVAVSNVTSDLVANAAASNKTYKIESVIIANKVAGLVSLITVTLVRGTTQAGTYYLANQIPVPPSNVLNVITRESCIYLLEDDKIQVVADIAGRVDAICAYEICG